MRIKSPKQKNYPNFDPADYPTLKMCFGSTEFGGTQTTDYVGGNITTRGASNTARTDGGVDVAGVNGAWTLAGPTFTPGTGSDLLMVSFGDGGAAATELSVIGHIAAANPSLMYDTTGSSYVTLITGGAVYAECSSTPAIASGAVVAYGLKYDASATQSLEAFSMSSAGVFTTSTGVNNTGTLSTQEWDAIDTDYSTANKGAILYGHMIFEFTGGLPSDIDEAIEWMYNDWIPINSTTPGKKRIWAAWQSLS